VTQGSEETGQQTYGIGAESEAVLARARAERRSLPSQVFYILRRWPVIPLFVMVLLVVGGVFAPWISPIDAIQQNLVSREHPPTWGRGYIDICFEQEHDVFPDEADYDLTTSSGKTAYNRAKRTYHSPWVFILGGDHLGRDVLSRVIGGARVSLQVVSVALASGVTIGTLMGLFAGYYGGWTDEILMRIVDMWLSLPFLLIALVIALIFGAKTSTVILLLALLAWPPFVRQVRADVLVIRSRDYVEAARIAGASNLRILYKHVLPGTYSTILVIASLRVGQLILAEAALSFLGAGIPDPIPAWGKSVSEGRAYIDTAWWIAFFPGLAIFLVAMALNFFGDWLRDRLDPRLRQLD